MRLGLGCCLVVFLFLAAGNAAAEEMFIYPNEGQSQDQMEKDKFDFYGWAKSSTGFDPMAPPTARRHFRPQEDPSRRI